MKISPGCCGREADGFGYGVGGFERRDDAFGAAELDGGGYRVIVVGTGAVFGAGFVVQPGVFGSDGGVIETGGNGVGEGDLAVVILQQVAAGALENAGGSAGEAGGVVAEFVAASAGFDADELDAVVVQ